MAAFQVITIGRFWVITEERRWRPLVLWQMFDVLDTFRVSSFGFHQYLFI